MYFLSLFFAIVLSSHYVASEYNPFFFPYAFQDNFRTSVPIPIPSLSKTRYDIVNPRNELAQESASPEIGKLSKIFMFFKTTFINYTYINLLLLIFLFGVNVKLILWTIIKKIQNFSLNLNLYFQSKI